MNNAFGLAGSTYLSWTENNVRTDQRVIRGDNRLLSGKIVNVTDHHHISQHYDVQLNDYKDVSGNGIILRACKRLVVGASFDGVGVYSPLEEGDPIFLMSKNGKIEDSVIIGSFYTNGIYNDFLRDGNGDKPFKTYADTISTTKAAAQASIHPSRIAQPDSWIHIVGGKNLATPFDDPKYHKDLIAQRQASPQVASIEIKNKNGDIVQYSSGSQVYYADKELIIITNANGSSRCQSLNEACHYYLCLIDKSLDYLGIDNPSASPKEESMDNPIIKDVRSDKKGVIPKEENMDMEDPSFIASPATKKPPAPSPTSSDINKVSNTDVISIDYNEWAPTGYHLDQAKKLATIYREAAEQCNKGTMVSTQIASSMKDNPSETTSITGKPKEEKGQVGTCNYAKRTPSKFKPLLVLHETASTGASALAHIAASDSYVAYHALIKREGTIVRLVDEKDNAYGAGCSSYPSISKGPDSFCDSYSSPLGNEETDCIPIDIRKTLANKGCSTSNSVKCSVNNFAIHYSLESPEPYTEADGHAGYTKEQYVSLAHLIINSKVDLSRITTHYLIDNSGSRRDPRSLSIEALTKELSRQGAKGEIGLTQEDIKELPGTTSPNPFKENK
jgi:hypothetical protein